MSEWLESVLLEKNNLPRYNDSPFDVGPNPKDVLFFANSFLKETNFKNKGIRLILINKIKKNNINKNFKFIKKDCTDLPHTGWTIIRSGHGWELTFKNGIACPKHLPAHVHSDLLSFDLFYKGIPVLAGAGTSIYEEGKIRNYERSGQSQNLLQLAPYTLLKKRAI